MGVFCEIASLLLYTDICVDVEKNFLSETILFQ